MMRRNRKTREVWHGIRIQLTLADVMRDLVGAAR
jgi:hypothetical protein